ncbi:MAG: GNAT family N-acetyltransferase [Caldilineaceae bacterium]
MQDQNQAPVETWQPHQPGSAIHVRPLAAADAELIDAMHQRLSPQSVYYRYLQYRKPTLAESAAVAQLDPAKGAGLVAINPAPTQIVGLAYYVREPHAPEPTAEAGILVEDQYQAQGIGRRLWQQLQLRAQTERIRWLRVLFHPSNQRMLRLVRGCGLPYQVQAGDDLNDYLVALDASPNHAQANPTPVPTNTVSAVRAKLKGKWRSIGNQLYRQWELALQMPSEVTDG